MSYVIVYLRDGRELASTPWAGDLASAQTHARDSLAAARMKHNATSVQVVDAETRKFVYWYAGKATPLPS